MIKTLTAEKPGDTGVRISSYLEARYNVNHIGKKLMCDWIGLWLVILSSLVECEAGCLHMGA